MPASPPHVATPTLHTPYFVCKAFAQLSVHELQALHMLRQQVFVVEQNCAYQDADVLDESCWHLFTLDEDGLALATCRLLPAGLRYAEASIGRVACAPSARGTGLGRALMLQALRQLAQLSAGPVRISAQQYLQRFYESLGFVAVGSPYLEDNIPHLEMLKK